MGRRAKPGEAQAFLAAALAADTDDCILWPFATINGYGRVVHNGKQSTLSRVVLELSGTPQPSDIDHPLGVMALHSCDNRACCNRRHLRWGDHVENMADRRRRRRDKSRGFAALSRVGLVAEDIRIIRQRVDRGEPVSRIAADFDIRTDLVRDIAARRTWKYVA